MMKDNLADRYRHLRANKNLTISKLARELGCNPKTLSFYENGTREMPRDVLIKYANYFNVSVDFLLGRTDDPDPQSTAVDDLQLSHNAVAIIKEYSPITHYSGGSVFDILLEHKEFENILIALASLMQYADKINSGRLGKTDIWDISDIIYTSLIPGILENEYNKSFDEIMEYFGSFSGVIGGRNLLEYEAFKAKKSFDIILESFINKVTERFDP